MVNKIKLKLKGTFYIKESTNQGVNSVFFAYKVTGTFIKYENKNYWYITENLVQKKSIIP